MFHLFESTLHIADCILKLARLINMTGILRLFAALDTSETYNELSDNPTMRILSACQANSILGVLYQIALDLKLQFLKN